MAATLKMKLFLVVLVFGFFVHPQVDGLECYHCPVRLGSVDQDCKIVKLCDKPKPACSKFHQTEPSKRVGHRCASLDNETFGDFKDSKSKCINLDQADSLTGRLKAVTCQCVTNLCNSVGHLHGWTFVQIITISFVVVFAGAASWG